MAIDTSNLPTVAVVTIGHYRHGKSSVTAAISRVLAARTGAAPVSVHDLDRRSGSPDNLVDRADPGVTCTVVAGHTRYATEHRRFLHIDCPGKRPWLKNAARAQGLADAAVLVVSAPDGVQPQTHEHLLLARALGIHRLVVFINKCDLVHDLEWIDLVERDTRELLERTGFDGDSTRILRGAALPVLAGDPSTPPDSPWTASILDLVDALEHGFTVPTLDQTGPPLIYIHAAHASELPRHVVVEGRLRRGVIRSNDKLVLLGHGELVDVRVTDIEVARTKTDLVAAGERIGLQLHSVDRHLSARTTFAGQALVPRDLARVHSELPATITLLPSSEGGRPTGIRSGHVSRFLFGTAVVAGRVHPPAAVVVQPGETAEVKISLVQPLYIEPGMPFAICDGNQGAGWRPGAPPKWAGTYARGTILPIPS